GWMTKTSAPRTLSLTETRTSPLANRPSSRSPRGTPMCCAMARARAGLALPANSLSRPLSYAIAAPPPYPLAPAGRPPFLVDLARPGDGQGVGGDVLGDGRTGGDVRAAADPHGGDQVGIAADEGAVLDHGGVLAVAVVVHRHRPGPDVHAGSDPRVAQVGVVVDLGPLAHLGVLELREVADPHAGGDATTRAHMAEG